MEVTSAISPKDILNGTEGPEITIESNPNIDPSVDTTADTFAAFMRQALGGDSKTSANEEELFAGLIEQRLGDIDKEAGAFYVQEKAKFLNSMRRADGYVSVEDAAVAALKSTVEAGKIDKATAEIVNAQAFRGAQLDDNLDALYDGIGSAGDPTVAVSDMEAALLSMRTVMSQVDDGSLSIESRPLDTPSNSISGGAHGGAGGAPGGSQVAMDGAEGFLWKPVSEGDGNLVVLLPTTLKGLIDRVEIHSELPPDASTMISKGRFAGDEHNGGRPHFRFEKPGAEYGSDVHVVVFKDGGETVTYEIGNGADRHD